VSACASYPSRPRLEHTLQDEKKEEPQPKDPVDAALENYSIICTNPWAPDVPCASSPASCPAAARICFDTSVRPSAASLRKQPKMPGICTC